MKTQFTAFVLSVAGTLISATLASAATGADIIFTFSSGGPESFDNATRGFQFTPVVNIRVDSFGYFDASSDGLSAGHSVGIWNTAGTLLASATVTTANSTLSGPVINGGQYRFTPIPGLQLAANTTYVFGAATAGSADVWYSGGTNISNSPALATVSSTGVFNLGPFALNFPGSNSGNTYAAGSFTASAVPEPSTFALAALGAVGLLIARFRR